MYNSADERDMQYDVLDLCLDRVVTLCGINIYLNPECHPDRIMPENDLVYICDGEWHITQDEQAYCVKAGDVIFLRAGSHHGGLIPCTPNTRTMFLHFTQAAGDQYKQMLSFEGSAACAKVRRACLPTVIHCGQYADISGLLHQIIDAYWSERADKKLQNTLLLNVLLNELAYIAGKSNQDEEERVTSIMRIFRNEPAKFFSLTELAAINNISVRTLTTYFRKITGQSIHQYQLNLKLDMAYAALGTTDRTIQDIAASYGFYDAYQFSRLFKKKYGKAPKNYKMCNSTKITKQSSP